MDWEFVVEIQLDSSSAYKRSAAVSAPILSLIGSDLWNMQREWYSGES